LWSLNEGVLSGLLKKEKDYHGEKKYESKNMNSMRTRNFKKILSTIGTFTGCLFGNSSRN
jgi:hypothetical protein